MNTETKTKIDELIAKLGVTIESIDPILRSEESKKDGKTAQWHHVAFNVTLRKEGKFVWSGPYKMGLGNFPEFKDLMGRNLTVYAETEIKSSIANRNPRRPFRTRPSLPGVLYSLFSDGEGYFDRLSFEEWAGNYGYDEDSRTAERMFRECQETGRKLARAFTAAEIQELREAFQDY